MAVKPHFQILKELISAKNLGANFASKDSASEGLEPMLTGKAF